MSERRPIYKKGSLLYATIVALACVMTASVSTFAWFQAEANVRISTTNSSTTITVSEPDTFTLGSAEIYSYTDNGTTGYTGAASGSIADDENLSNFRKLNTTELKTRYLSISSLLPGRKMSFGIKISTTGGERISSASLSVTGYTTTNNNYRQVLSAVTDGGSGTLAQYSGPVQKIIRIEDIVKFHGVVNSTGSFALGNSSVLTDYDVTYTSGTGVQTKSYSSVDYEISAGSSLNSSTIFLFYTIEFANDSTTWYQEYTYSDSKYHKCYSVIANNYAGARYFFADGTYGNSTCYEGLSFRIDDMQIKAY